MILRTCDCGHDIIYIDPQVGFVVFCHTCDKETPVCDTAEQAMNAWNDGTVG